MTKTRHSIRYFTQVIALCLLASGCGSSAKTTGTNSSRTDLTSRKAQTVQKGMSREPTQQEREVIRQLMRETEEIRGLKFKGQVPVLIQDRVAITAHIEEQFENEYEDLERARIVYTALGMLRPDLDIKTLLLQVLGEQILGYFDPKTKRLVVRDDIMYSLRSEHLQKGRNAHNLVSEARISLVHELAHALQSQHLSLSENIEKERDIDEENAFRSVIEGDATLTMYGYMLKMQQPDWKIGQLTRNPVWIQSLSSMIDQMPMAGPELAKAPSIIRIPLLSAYIDGLTFVAHLHGKGGWQAINQAHEIPPKSTEQVLHPTRFFRQEMPVKVNLPKLPAIKEAGFHMIEEDTLGELEISIYFGQGIDQDQDDRAATGWSWDRLRVYQGKNHQTPVIWFTLWDNEKEATEAEEAAELVMDRISDRERKFFGVFRRGEMVIIIRNLEPRLHKHVFNAWKSLDTLPASTDSLPNTGAQ